MAKKRRRIKYTIVVTLFNEIGHAINHIKIFEDMAQSRRDFEVIFCDDGSHDGTKRLFEILKASFNFTYTYSEHDGFGCARMKNRGIKLARGDWILITDGDNFLEDDILEVYDEVDPTHNKIYFGQRQVDGKDPRGELKSIPQQAKYNHFSGSNVLFSSAHISEWAPADIFNEYGFDDYYFAMKQLSRGREIIAVKDAISYHEVGKRKNPSKKHKEMIAAEEKKLLPKSQWVFNA